MRLSEAIRLGAMLGAKTDALFFGRDGASCALGAALRAVGINGVGETFLGPSKELDTRWPWMETVSVACPVCRRQLSVRRQIPHLNNSAQFGDHDWPREQIADWVETIEATQGVVLEPSPAVDAVDPSADNTGNTTTRD